MDEQQHPNEPTVPIESATPSQELAHQPWHLASATTPPTQQAADFKAVMQRRVSVPMWGVLASGVLLLCTMCSCLALATSNGNKTGGASTSGVAVVSATATATHTPGPTATPMPTSTPAPTATPKPTPTPTHAPQWTTVQHFGGSVNQQTDTFHIADGSHIVWAYNITDTANFFALDLYDSSGSLVDNLANYANESSGQQSTYTVHGDGDYYLKIESDSVNWTIDVQAYQ